MHDVFFRGTGKVSVVSRQEVELEHKGCCLLEILLDWTASIDDGVCDEVRNFRVDVPSHTIFRVIKVVDSVPFLFALGDRVEENHPKLTAAF